MNVLPPFQMHNSPDSILQQRINERNLTDIQNGARPMHSQVMPNMGQFSNSNHLPAPVMQSGGGTNVHPAIVHKFLSMDPEAQNKFARNNPEMYAQIHSAIFKQQYQQQQQQIQQMQQYDYVEDEVSSRTDTVSESSKSSDTDNDHSSDSDMESSKKRRKHRKRGKQRTLDLKQKHKVFYPLTYLSLDFRSDIKEVSNDRYLLGFPTQHNIKGVALESCLINRNALLEKEPCIYMSIKEIPGDYLITMGHKCVPMFGKLIQEKTVNGFIVYKPENCAKQFPKPQRLSKLTVSFLRYDLTPLPLNKINVKKIRQSTNYIKITSKTPHYLSIGDRVNICCSHSNGYTVDIVKVLDVINDHVVALEETVHPLSSGSNLQFEKVNLKCNLTFKLLNTTPYD